MNLDISFNSPEFLVIAIACGVLLAWVVRRDILRHGFFPPKEQLGPLLETAGAGRGNAGSMVLLLALGIGLLLTGELLIAWAGACLAIGSVLWMAWSLKRKGDG